MENQVVKIAELKLELEKLFEDAKNIENNFKIFIIDNKSALLALPYSDMMDMIKIFALAISPLNYIFASVTYICKAMDGICLLAELDNAKNACNKCNKDNNDSDENILNGFLSKLGIKPKTNPPPSSGGNSSGAN